MGQGAQWSHKWNKGFNKKNPNEPMAQKEKLIGINTLRYSIIHNDIGLGCFESPYILMLNLAQEDMKNPWKIQSSWINLWNFTPQRIVY